VPDTGADSDVIVTGTRERGRTQFDTPAQLLLDRHRIFTVRRTGPAGGVCIRVTPALFTSMAEVDRLAAARSRGSLLIRRVQVWKRSVGLLPELPVMPFGPIPADDAGRPAGFAT